VLRNDEATAAVARYTIANPVRAGLARSPADYPHWDRSFTRANSCWSTSQGPPEGGPYEGGPYEGGPYEGGPYEGGPYEGGPYEGGSYEGGPYDGGRCVGVLSERRAPPAPPRARR
jgi:hypothetical protein